MGIIDQDDQIILLLLSGSEEISQRRYEISCFWAAFEPLITIKRPVWNPGFQFLTDQRKYLTFSYISKVWPRRKVSVSLLYYIDKTGKVTKRIKYKLKRQNNGQKTQVPPEWQF